MSSREQGRHKPRHHTHAVKPDNKPKKKLPPLGWELLLQKPEATTQETKVETAPATEVNQA